MEQFCGYPAEEFSFRGRQAILVRPRVLDPQRRWMLKTEYFGAFPQTEEALLARGFHLAYLQNRNRWGLDEDIRDKADFVRYVSETFSLAPRCVPVGMSCGGLMAVDLAALAPERVSVLYLDAPVLNLLSCAGGFGCAEITPDMQREMLDALGMTLTDLINFRRHPMDRLEPLVRNRIPALLVYGDSDRTVPYEENGIHLERAYREAGVPLLVQCKPGCDHHPHGPGDSNAALAFLLEHSAEAQA